MKTDQEIKDWIDSKDILTKQELLKFMYGKASRSRRANRHWDYVLKTKNWNSIKKYQCHKIKDGGLDKEKFLRFKKIYSKDLRLRQFGRRKGQAFLESIYGFHISKDTITNYKKRIEDEQKEIDKLSKFFDIDFSIPIIPYKGIKDNIDLALADIHRPFHHKTLYKLTIDENENCGDVFIAGDWWDLYSKNHYRKTHSGNFREEFKDGYLELQNLARRFKKVYIMLSNHDQRFKKWIFDNVPDEIIDLVDYNIIETVLKFIPNLKVVKQDIGERKIEYIYQHKNVIFTHIERSLAGITKTVQENAKDFGKWQETFKTYNYDAIIQAHNHQSGKVRFGDIYAIQIPCLIDINAYAFDYVFNGQLKGNPPALGYMRMIKDKSGRYDMRKSYIIDY